MNIQVIIDNYVSWIKDNTTYKQIQNGSSYEVTTPFMDRHNDHLQIYIFKQKEEYFLTDAGYTLSDLEMSGLEINTPKRKAVLDTTLNGFGVQINENKELCIKANLSNIGQKKHYLLQAILAVNDMYILSQNNIYSFFKEDVERFFQSNNIIFSKDIKLGGKTGFDHNVDFIISAYGNKPERLIKTINKADKDQITATIFSFEDIKQIRQQKTQNYILYNDETSTQSKVDLFLAAENYGVISIPWTKKEIIKKEFAFVA